MKLAGGAASVLMTVAALFGCAPEPVLPVLPALTDPSAGEREVLTLDGFVANSAIAVPDSGGITLFVGRIINGQESMVATHSDDGVTFGPTREVTFARGLHSVLDVFLDGDVWRALHDDGSGGVLLASSSDGIRFDDEVPVSISGASVQPFAPRLVRRDGALHIYFMRDTSGVCGDTSCPRFAVGHASSADASGAFGGAVDVLADPTQSGVCAGCAVDVWQLVDVVRPGADRCSFPSPVLTALRPHDDGVDFDFDAVPVGDDDVTPGTPEKLASVNDIRSLGNSVVATETTYAIYTSHFDGSSPVRGHVRVTVIPAPHDARPTCD